MENTQVKGLSSEETQDKKISLSYTIVPHKPNFSLYHIEYFVFYVSNLIIFVLKMRFHEIHYRISLYILNLLLEKMNK